MTSAGCPSQLTDTRTLWPSARSIAAQRTAVCRLPLRERAPAGVISAIFMLCLNGAMTLAYPDPDTLSRQLQSARERTRLLTRDLEGPQLFGPKLPIVNPVLWELGHVAWFQERWCLMLRADESLSERDRKSTRLNSSHRTISYAVFCLKKKNGALRFNVGGPGVDVVVFRAVELLQIPPHVPHGVEVLDDAHVIDIFNPLWQDLMNCLDT